MQQEADAASHLYLVKKREPRHIHVDKNDYTIQSKYIFF